MITDYAPVRQDCPAGDETRDGRDDLLGLLLDLADAGIPVQLVAPGIYVEPCGLCAEDLDFHRAPADSVATVEARTLGGFVFRTPACVLHLDEEARYNARHLGLETRVAVPNEVAA